MRKQMTIAETVLAQIKHFDHWFLGAVAAHGFIAVERGLQFFVSGANRKVRKVQVILNGLDLYDVKFYGKLDKRTMDVPLVHEVENVFVEDLVQVLDYCENGEVAA